MKGIHFGIVALLLAVALQGCSSKGTTKAETADQMGSAGAGVGTESGPEISTYGGAKGAGSRTGGAGGGYGTGAGSYGEGGAGGDPALNDPASPLSQRIIYFDYDSYEVLPEHVSVVNAHANYLVSNSGRTVTLEGHADERGSSEYNIALGEQRARSVAHMLTLQGVSESQIQIVSFGEEKPAATGSDESAWQQNRRVEITYPGH